MTNYETTSLAMSVLDTVIGHATAGTSAAHKGWPVDDLKRLAAELEQRRHELVDRIADLGGYDNEPEAP